MPRRRFIADLVAGDRAALIGTHAAHLSRVLRARPGQEFDIAADGRVRRGRVIAVADERVEFELGDEVHAVAASPVVLYLAVFKFDRMEWAVEKCTELGAARIVPVIAARTDSHLAHAAGKRVERWRRLAMQAAEQSRQAVPPEISPPTKLKREILAAASGRRMVLAETEQQLSLKEAMSTVPSMTLSEVALAVGPEGGWTDGELRLFSDAGWTRVSLGHSILRAETAVIAALAIVMSELR